MIFAVIHNQKSVKETTGGILSPVNILPSFVKKVHYLSVCLVEAQESPGVNYS